MESDSVSPFESRVEEEDACETLEGFVDGRATRAKTPADYQRLHDPERPLLALHSALRRLGLV
jgi:hypothetical protein